jgi:D-alanyl-D-alanine carboxypeptidase (penicillin-binding protein 5/6)
VPVEVKENKYVTLPREASPAIISFEIEMDENVTAPIEAGQVVGKILVLEGMNLIGEVDIVATASIVEGMFLSRFGIEDSTTRIILLITSIIVGIVLLLALLYIVLKIRYTLIRKARRRKRAMEIAMERDAREKELKDRKWPY